MGQETDRAAVDNERPRHRVELGDYWIDRYPVTNGQYRQFIQADGYENSQWWTEAGWHWRLQHKITQPLYWSADGAWDQHPVCGVSWYEAAAYARFCGKRLPTEAEWEKAASWNPATARSQLYPWGDPALTDTNCDRAKYANHFHQVGWTTPVNAYGANQSPLGCRDMLGNVWEWTDSWFQGYDGFQPYPYVGYSQVFFDGQHRVLRGGSWATRPWALRNSFRNWYYPTMRQLFAGFRCATSATDDPAAS
jgi:ergothioneine biosynthesis protein EgtB